MIIARPGHFVIVGANNWHCTCSPDAHGNGGSRGPLHGAEIHLRSAGVPQRKRNWRPRRRHGRRSRVSAPTP